MRPTVTLDTIGAAIVTHYLETGRAANAEDIAARLGCSAPTVRKRLHDPRSVPGCVYVAPDRTLRQRKRWMPALDTLRGMLLAARPSLVPAPGLDGLRFDTDSDGSAYINTDGTVSGWIGTDSTGFGGLQVRFAVGTDTADVARVLCVIVERWNAERKGGA